MEQDILGRLNQFKHNVQNLWEKYSDHDFELARKKIGEVSDLVKEKIHKMKDDDEIHPIHIDNYHYESHHVDDLPLTMAKDSEPGVRFYDTENSPLSRGAPKSPARGIDSFGEDDEVEKELIKRPRAKVSQTRAKKKTKSKRTLH